MTHSARVRWLRLLAVLLVFGFLAAACGDDDGGGGTETSDDASDTTAGDTQENPDEEGTPVPGGKLVYGLEAATATPWTPAKSVCAISCHMIMRSVYDTLTLYGEDLEVHPNLASFAHNDDYTQWTLTPVEGVTFHDGTPFDAAAIKANLDAHKASFLTAKALLDVQTVEVVGTDAVVTTGHPWSNFPVFLAGQIGYMASPTWLAAAAEDASLETKPVGTGPFVFKSFDTNTGTFAATKNPDYWREGLPYLDEIEYRVLADVQSRKNALLSGEIDIMHTSSGDAIKQLRDEDSIELNESSAYGETGYTLLNVAEEFDKPINDVRVRRALAMATDVQTLIDTTGGGIGEIANGPFSPDQPGYLDETGYPEYDPEGAKALIDEYKAEKGVDKVEVKYTTTPDPINLQTAEILKTFWEQAGVTVTLAQIEQSQFIVTALQGNFEAFAWRNHGGIDPDGQRVWWHSETADKVGEGLALNFGRIRDDVIDENLQIIRESDDPAERTAAAEEINKRFGEQAYNLWGSWTIWGIAKKPEVNGLGAFVLPDGTNEIRGNGIGGSHQIAQLWIEQ